MKSSAFWKQIGRDSGMVVGGCADLLFTLHQKIFLFACVKKQVKPQMGLLSEFATEIGEVMLLWTNLGAIIVFIW